MTSSQRSHGAPTDADLLSTGWRPGGFDQEKCFHCGGPCEGVARDCRMCRPCAVKGWRTLNRNYGTALGDKLRAAGFGGR